ncbi:MAG TPA: hypothetical protein PKX93_05975 [bacterium]|nr:hypothetical protein [bacterium]HOL66988.1 hypothetical protein [bacterium]HPP11932.1 hypothetical protein [bacterium]
MEGRLKIESGKTKEKVRLAGGLLKTKLYTQREQETGRLRKRVLIFLALFGATLVAWAAWSIATTMKWLFFPPGVIFLFFFILGMVMLGCFFVFLVSHLRN